ncbi:MFS transporter [Nocardioides kribbensis]|uniref:MFS transporter n=1 Tax=Nocardioides kribbensis TaxID=305517 RepID=A0ABV1NTC7_9ACTN
MVNTVNYVRDDLGGSQVDVAWMLAASGGGTLLVALLLPRILDRSPDRNVMLTGAAVLVIGAAAAVALAALGFASFTITATIGVLIGAGMALIVTPTGRVLRRSVEPRFSAMMPRRLGVALKVAIPEATRSHAFV